MRLLGEEERIKERDCLFRSHSWSDEVSRQGKDVVVRRWETLTDLLVTGIPLLYQLSEFVASRLSLPVTLLHVLSRIVTVKFHRRCTVTFNLL